jgi:Na+-translocating ferredoxin:NAD+ oxidoreductase RnfD subunit
MNLAICIHTEYQGSYIVLVRLIAHASTSLQARLVSKPYSNALKLQDQFVTCRLNRIRINSFNSFVIHDCGLIVAVYRGRYEFHLCVHG